MMPSMDMRASRPRFTVDFNRDRDYDRDKTFYRHPRYRDRDYERDRDYNRDRDYDLPRRQRNKPYPKKKYPNSDIEMVRVIPVVHPFLVSSPPHSHPRVVIIPASGASSFSFPELPSSSLSTTGNSGGKQIIIQSIPSGLATPTPLEAPLTSTTVSTSTTAATIAEPKERSNQLILANVPNSSSQSSSSSGTTVLIMASGSSNIPSKHKIPEADPHDSHETTAESGVSRTEINSPEEISESTTIRVSSKAFSGETSSGVKEAKGMDDGVDSRLGKKYLKLFTLQIPGSQQRILIPPPVLLNSQKVNTTGTAIERDNEDNSSNQVMTTDSGKPTESNLLANLMQQMEGSSALILNQSQTQKGSHENESTTTKGSEGEQEVGDRVEQYTYSVSHHFPEQISHTLSSKDFVSSTTTTAFEQEVMIKDITESTTISPTSPTLIIPDFL